LVVKFKKLNNLGQRVLAQTIIPGILNSDHNECTEFGSIDDGKTIHSNPEVYNNIS